MVAGSGTRGRSPPERWTPKGAGTDVRVDGPGFPALPIGRSEPGIRSGATRNGAGRRGGEVSRFGWAMAVVGHTSSPTRPRITTSDDAIPRDLEVTMRARSHGRKLRSPRAAGEPRWPQSPPRAEVRPGTGDRWTIALAAQGFAVGCGAARFSNDSPSRIG